jgi:hypothetical protein
LTSTRFEHFRRPSQSPTTPIAKAHSAPAEAPPPSASVVPEPPAQLEVNLALLSTTRGDGSDRPQRDIHLPAKAVHVRFLLPTGMEPGEYAIRLQDATGFTKVQRQVDVVLSDGVASFTLDLQFEPSDIGRTWKLMIREPGLSWRSYSVVIG